MRTTTVYLVDWDDSPFHEAAVPTLEAAREIARREAERNGNRSGIRRVTVPLVPIREAVCNLLEHEAFASDAEVVETYVPENVVDDYWSPEGPRWSYRVEGRE